MQIRKPLVIASCLTVMGLSLASCAPTTAPTPPAAAKAPAVPTPPAALPSPQAGMPTLTPKPAAEQPRYGGILTKALVRDTSSFDVHREQTSPASHTLFNIYQGLVRLHPVEHSKIVPELAEKWELSPDGKTYTFNFYQGVKWHDGKPFTMEDVKYSLERMHNPKEFNTIAPRAEGMLVAMDKVEIAGADSIKITTQYASASFLDNLANGWVAVQPKHIILAKGDMRRDAIGTGPFKFKEFVPNISLELVKNANYFVKDLPYVDGIKFYTVPDDATRFAAFRTGKVKMTFVGSPGLSPTQAEVARREMADKAIVHAHDALMRYNITFNMKKAPWDDVRVRKAVDLALDRQAGIKIYGAGSLGSLMSGQWGMNDEEAARLPGRRQPKDVDLAEAKRLLAEAGYPKGFKTTLLCQTGGAFETLSVVAKAQLAAVGIDVDLTLMERATMDERVMRRAFDTFLAGWALATDDPDEILYTYLLTGGGRNRGGFSDQEMDELIARQSRTLDREARKRILAEIETKAMEKVPAAGWFSAFFYTGHWKEVQNYKPGPGIHPWGKLDHVWLSK